LPQALTGLVRLYKAWSKPDKAAEWQQKLADFEKEQSEAAAGDDPGAPKSEPGRTTP
jgi:hypothetical protein